MKHLNLYRRKECLCNTFPTDFGPENLKQLPSGSLRVKKNSETRMYVCTSAGRLTLAKL